MRLTVDFKVMLHYCGTAPLKFKAQPNMFFSPAVNHHELAES